MASLSPYSEDLTCPICLTIFNDPVILHCGHSFCRDCITLSLKSLQQCPQCRTSAPTQGSELTTNHILKSLAERAKETERIKRELGLDKEAAGWFCPEHEEKLKLFCLTDQQLACIICRDGEKHEGHKFKPVKEAAAALKTELETFLQHVAGDMSSVQILANTQKGEMTKTKEKSQKLMTQISSQFQEMHQFLRQREDEIKTELKHKEEEEMKRMSENLNAVKAILAEGRELNEKVKSVLEITDCERLLKNWTEEKSVKAAKSKFKPKGSNLKVVNSSLSLMPYESHLQFFMWREMLQVIQPREERLMLQIQTTDSAVSGDQKSLLSACREVKPFPQQKMYKQIHYNPPQNNISALSTNQFSSGEHYWEIDVGQKNYWEVGINQYFLKYDGGTYSVSTQSKQTGISFKGTPQKIGVFLSLSSKHLSFYDADNMKLIHNITLGYIRSGQKTAYLNMGKNWDYIPMTVCWY